VSDVSESNEAYLLCVYRVLQNASDSSFGLLLTGNAQPVGRDISTTTKRHCISQLEYRDVTPPSHVTDVPNDADITSPSSVSAEAERCYNLGCTLHSRTNGMSGVSSTGCSGVVEGGRAGTPLPQIFCCGNGVPLSIIRTKGNSNTVAFPQRGLQRNEESIETRKFS